MGIMLQAFANQQVPLTDCFRTDNGGMNPSEIKKPDASPGYQFLKPKQGSNYQQLAVNGRIRAEIIYRETVGSEPLTPEEVAHVENTVENTVTL